MHGKQVQCQDIGHTRLSLFNRRWHNNFGFKSTICLLGKFASDAQFGRVGMPTSLAGMARIVLPAARPALTIWRTVVPRGTIIGAVGIPLRGPNVGTRSVY